MTEKIIKEKRRFSRYPIENLENVFLVFNNPKTGDEIRRPLFNLSYKGIGFLIQKNDSKNFPLEKELQAKILLKNDEIPISIEILYITPKFGGAKIFLKQPGDIRKIIRFISPMELGENLCPVKPEIIRQQDSKKKLTWYVGKNNTELILWRDQEKNLLEFSLVFLVYAVRGDRKKETLATANLNPLEMGYIPIYEPWPEDAAHWHNSPNRNILQLACEVIANGKNLNPIDQEEISSWILGATPSL